MLSQGPVWDPMSLGVRVIVQVASAGCSYVVSALELRLPRASAGRGELIRGCLVHYLVVGVSWRGHGTLLRACGICALNNLLMAYG